MVTIVDTGKELGQGLYPERKTRLFVWFKKKGVTMIGRVKREEITQKVLVIITSDGGRRTLEADSIMPALP